MPVEIFTRDEFEKALNFLPLGFKLLGAESGQLEYRAPIATRLTCECGVKFFPNPIYEKATCPRCGKVGNLSSTATMPGELFLKIYSSINPHTMRSRETGKDSIRFVLLDKKKNPLGKIGHYVTRLPGWENRIRNKCQELWALALRIPHCNKGHLGRICKCQSGENKNRIFAKCWKCNEWLGWLDEG